MDSVLRWNEVERIFGLYVSLSAVTSAAIACVSSGAVAFSLSGARDSGALRSVPGAFTYLGGGTLTGRSLQVLGSGKGDWGGGGQQA